MSIDRDVYESALERAKSLAADRALPLTAAGLHAFLGEVIADIAASHYLADAEPLSLDALIRRAEMRMPAVFALASPARGPAIAALQAAEEAVLEEGLPDGGFTWPPSPLWLASLTERTAAPLLEVLSDYGMPLPGTTHYLREIDRLSLPVITTHERPNGALAGRTAFLPISEEGGLVAQYGLDEVDGELHLLHRLKGERTFDHLATLHRSAARPLRALLRWWEESGGTTP